MKTIDYVKKYRNELEHNKNSSLFNIWAFLFSSLYFLYLGMWKYGLLFLILPLIICGILPFAEQSLWIFLVSNIIAGFVANPAYKKYREKYIETYKNGIQPNLLIMIRCLLLKL